MECAPPKAARKAKPPTHPAPSEAELTFYSDGGLVARTGAWGVHCPQAELEASSSFVPCPSSTFAEQQGLVNATRVAISHLKPHEPAESNQVLPVTSTVTFYTDSNSTVSSFKRWPSRNSISTDQYEILENISELQQLGIHTRIVWIPGHAGIPGNEVADELCTEAILYSDPTHIPIPPEMFKFTYPDPITNYKGAYSMWPLDRSTRKKLFRFPRHIATCITRLASNHHSLQGHHLRLAQKSAPDLPPEEDHLCRFCHASAETVKHLMRDCTHPHTRLAQTSLPGVLTLLPNRSGALSHLGSDFELNLKLSISCPAEWRDLFMFFAMLNIQL